MHINHLLSALSTRARSAIRRAWGDHRDVTTVEELVDVVTKKDLLAFQNCGRKSVAEIARVLRDMGYVLRVK
jgi:DNA-directed RNA polymerase alpha subunit